MLISTKKLSSEKPAYEIGDITIKNTQADESRLRAIEQKHHERLTMPDGSSVYKFAVNAGKEIFDELVKTA
ncbi:MULTISPECIES: hypothetical protein [unclassified Chryseobacterium]|uniref:hypothetical protein n=1 Tax=unclassified Chryseobacterium TaxID=2593645 RepID=UPI000D3BC32F|nr:MULTISPECIES: hypothetical protein [unclassified Chryseobacterium]MCQ4142696.1 hypothetical protein [Chryseobacterium sp. EO14]PTT75244.1 hypothetical protein DBR25_08800 [Chryseobacterium sp. HMWF001]PVV50768.1 hypothetical protein DD829_21430 [Chryseobacterium sp. HMWF035]